CAWGLPSIRVGDALAVTFRKVRCRGHRYFPCIIEHALLLRTPLRLYSPQSDHARIEYLAGGIGDDAGSTQRDSETYCADQRLRCALCIARKLLQWRRLTLRRLGKPACGGRWRSGTQRRRQLPYWGTLHS